MSKNHHRRHHHRQQQQHQSRILFKWKEKQDK